MSLAQKPTSFLRGAPTKRGSSFPSTNSAQQSTGHLPCASVSGPWRQGAGSRAEDSTETVGTLVLSRTLPAKGLTADQAGISYSSSTG